MTEVSSANSIIRFLAEVGSVGMTGSDLKHKSGMTDEEFQAKSDKLWLQQRLTGVRADGCCGRGCGFMCVSYMEEGHLWQLKERA